MIRNEKNVEVQKTLEEQIQEQEEQLAALKARQAEEIEKARVSQMEVAKANRKEEADVVKAAITERLEQETATRKAKAEAYKIYLEACDEAEKLLAEKREAERKALNDFCDKYGSFHDSITINDTTYMCNYSNKVSYVDPFKKLLDFWF